jgi:hypothetical protein
VLTWRAGFVRSSFQRRHGWLVAAWSGIVAKLMVMLIRLLDHFSAKAGHRQTRGDKEEDQERDEDV